MPTLTYFNARGVAEVIRYMLAAAGVEYEDKRITQEEWPALKPDQPFGQLPVFTLDNGYKIAQSKAICRYIARKYQMYGRQDCVEGDCDEATSIDVALEVCDEFTYLMVKCYMEKDPDRKEAAIKEIKEATPNIFEKYEKCLMKNNGGKGWVIGDKISYADCSFMATCETLMSFTTDKIFESSPNLQQYYDRVRAQEGIAAYIAKRPKTDY